MRYMSGVMAWGINGYAQRGFFSVWCARRVCRCPDRPGWHCRSCWQIAELFVSREIPHDVVFCDSRSGALHSCAAVGVAVQVITVFLEDDAQGLALVYGSPPQIKQASANLRKVFENSIFGVE